MLREPTIPVPQEAPSSAIEWHTLHCELITPLYGGGVESTKVDEKMPIRVSSIRGQLRFWWRLLAMHKWQISDLRKAETDLWGGMNQGEDDGKASKVLLKVVNISKPVIEKWAEYKPNHNGKLNLHPKEEWANVPYVLFPAQGTLKNGRTDVDEQPHQLLKPGFKWNLMVNFSPSINSQNQGPMPSEIEQVWESIRWWSNFGGIGARARRGLGSIEIQQNDYFKKVVSVDEIKQLGLSVSVKTANNIYSAWTHAVNKLQSFRQIGAGRNNHSSRSHWSEPDAIRQLTNQSISKHSNPKTKGNIFPRAGFGLPIITKFKDNNFQGTDTSSNVDPRTTTLNLQYRKDKSAEWQRFERLASPLILRPYINENGQCCSLALVLPVVLHDTDKFQPLLENSNKTKIASVEFWDLKKSKDIRPIAENGGGDPLQAFLTYFAK